LPGAEFTLNRLLRTLERSPLPIRDGSVTMTFSAGLAQWQTGESAEQVIERADEAMYAAKRAGRARVHVAEQAVAEPAAGAAPG
jgi:PleD family two-component response regulator